MIIFPNAKINIGLNVVSRRDNGYHNLETVFYPVKINDALEVVRSAELRFTSSGFHIPGNAAENLCIKAYHLLRGNFDLPDVHIHLHKNIPIGAGLGGGSADAAFCIRLLNDQFELGLSADDMEGYARQLGADCAFFIQNQPVFAFEKGDRFKSIRLDLSKYYLVLVMPPVQVSTAQAYQNVNPGRPAEPLENLIVLPVEEWQGRITNDFESFVFKQHPQVKQVKNNLYDAGALYASMSGSGSSVFGIFKDAVWLEELEKENKVFYGV